MLMKDSDRLQEPCQAASKEMNPARLMKLIDEIIESLDRRKPLERKPLPAG